MPNIHNIEDNQNNDYEAYHERYGEYPTITYDPSLTDQARIGGAYTPENTPMADYDNYKHTRYVKRSSMGSLEHDDFLRDHMLMLPILQWLGRFPNDSFGIETILRQLVRAEVIPASVDPLNVEVLENGEDNPLKNRVVQAMRYLRIGDYACYDPKKADNNKKKFHITICEKGLEALADDPVVAVAKLKLDYDRMHACRESRE